MLGHAGPDEAKFYARMKNEEPVAAQDTLMLQDWPELILPAAHEPVVTSLMGILQAYVLAARGFGIAADAALAAYVWSWLENQVLAAIKLVPLGQVAGQRLLTSLGARIPSVVMTASTLPDNDLSTFAPGLALASARHETQYTRLFRS